MSCPASLQANRIINVFEFLHTTFTVNPLLSFLKGGWLNREIRIRSLTLVPEVFLDFSSRKRSRASREAATTSRESDEEREKNLWLH